jgi:hypothetical protein
MVHPVSDISREPNCWVKRSATDWTNTSCPKLYNPDNSDTTNKATKWELKHVHDDKIQYSCYNNLPTNALPLMIATCIPFHFEGSSGNSPCSICAEKRKAILNKEEQKVLLQS